MTAIPIGRFTRVAAALAGVVFASAPAAAQAPSPSEVTFKQVAPDLYFLFEFTSSNAVVLVTDDGVLVIDTRQHPRDGQELLDRSARPPTSRSSGSSTPMSTATIISATRCSRREARPSSRKRNRAHDEKKCSRRKPPGAPFLQEPRFDPSEVKLVMPDVTFDSEMTIRLGGREVRLAYLGPGQQAGDTFVFFPHARMVFTTGMFGPRSMPNMAFTPSVENWIKLLDQLAAMDVDKILPAHGDVSTSKDVKELAAMVADEYATVQAAIAKGTTLDEALQTVKLPQYKDWRNYNRLDVEIRSLYELIRTGKRSYFD